MSYRMWIWASCVRWYQADRQEEARGFVEHVENLARMVSERERGYPNGDKLG